MSSKISSLLLTFKSDVSEEYADKIKDAISMFNHVLRVDSVESCHEAKWQAEHDAKMKLYDFMKENWS